MSEPTLTDKKAANRKVKTDLERQEETSYGGLSPRSQKQSLIDTRRIALKFPERHFRYVRKDRVEAMEDMGYAQVSQEDAKTAKMSVTRAELVLMSCAKVEHAARRTAVEVENRRRLSVSRGQFAADVAHEERELRDRGVLAPGQSLLVTDAD